MKLSLAFFCPLCGFFLLCPAPLLVVSHPGLLFPLLLHLLHLQARCHLRKVLLALLLHLLDRKLFELKLTIKTLHHLELVSQSKVFLTYKLLSNLVHPQRQLLIERTLFWAGNSANRLTWRLHREIRSVWHVRVVFRLRHRVQVELVQQALATWKGAVGNYLLLVRKLVSMVWNYRSVLLLWRLL